MSRNTTATTATEEPGPTTETVASTCIKCGQEFVARMFVFDWSTTQTRLVVRICTPCGDAIEARRVAQLLRDTEDCKDRRRAERDADWKRLCPQEFRLTTECNGSTSIAKLELAQPLMSHVMQWKGPKGLIIRGRTGRCKSRVMWRLMRRLWLEGRTITVLTAAQFDRQCRDAGGNFTLTEWFESLANVDVLFIDDLGKAQWTQGTEAQFFDLVDQRAREHRPMMITTNDDSTSLAAQLSDNRSEPLIRRLKEFCESVVF